jgi:transposase
MEWCCGPDGMARCEAEYLTLRLSAALFGAAGWAALQTWFQATVRAGHWLSAPFRVMTAEAETPAAPRWKQVSVDVLSWLIFLVLVPADHALVGLWQAVDWAAINRLGAPCYQNSQRGQRAWAPAQLFALLVLFFVLPAPSECALLRLVAIVPLYRWFCGFGIFSPLPDHSMLYTFRQRLGEARFEAILTWVVQRCQAAGLIANELAYFDMMGVAASAHPWTPYERAVLLTQALLRYLEQAEPGTLPPGSLPETLRQLVAEVALEVLENKRLQQDPKTPSRVLLSLTRWTQQRQAAPGTALWELALEEAVQTVLAADTPAPPPALPTELTAQRPWLKAVAQRLKAQLPHARGDVEARVAWVSDVRLRCGYWLGFLVDSLCHVVTAVPVVPLTTVQQTQMLPALDDHQARLGAYPRAVAADSAQDYDPVHQGLAARHVQGHIASRNHQAAGGGCSSDHFTWDEPERLCCPAGQVLTPGQPRKDGLTPFQAPRAACAACARQTKCLPKGQQPEGPRVIHLDPVAHRRWLQNRAHTRTAAYKTVQRQRFASEGLFGLAVRLHGAEKMPYRSTAMNHIAGLMMGIVMDLALLA